MIVDYYIDVIYSKEQMFNLVADYEKYPQFVKSCVGATTHSVDANSVIASLAMSYAGISQEFATKTSFFARHKITMDLHEGSFKRLTGFWEFSDLASQATPPAYDQTNIQDSEQGDNQAELKTRVRLYMDYEMNPLLEMFFGAKYHKTLLGMVANFVQRAQELYD